MHLTLCCHPSTEGIVPFSVGDSGPGPCWAYLPRGLPVPLPPTGQKPSLPSTTCFLLHYLTHKLREQVDEPTTQLAKMKDSPVAVLAKGNGEEKRAFYRSCHAFKHESNPKKAIRSAVAIPWLLSCLQHCHCGLLLALLKCKQFK